MKDKKKISMFFVSKEEAIKVIEVSGNLVEVIEFECN